MNPTRGGRARSGLLQVLLVVVVLMDLGALVAGGLLAKRGHERAMAARADGYAKALGDALIGAILNDDMGSTVGATERGLARLIEDPEVRFAAVVQSQGESRSIFCLPRSRDGLSVDVLALLPPAATGGAPYEAEGLFIASAPIGVPGDGSGWAFSLVVGTDARKARREAIADTVWLALAMAGVTLFALVVGILLERRVAEKAEGGFQGGV